MKVNEIINEGAGPGELRPSEMTKPMFIKLLSDPKSMDIYTRGAYLGKNSTSEQIAQAIVSVKRRPGKKSYGKRGFAEGYGYDVVVDHSKLNYEGKSYPPEGKQEHLMVVTTDGPKDYGVEIFDGEPV